MIRTTCAAASWIALAAGATGCTIVFDLDGDDPPLDGPIDAPADAVADSPAGDPRTSCAIELPCPPSPPGTVTLCGRLHDVETGQVIAAAQPTREPCTTVTAGGPCSLRLRYFDALDFSQSPPTATPLVPAEGVVDDCGRFRGAGIPRATFGFIGIAVDDPPGSGAAHVLTLVVLANSAEPVAGVRAHATRSTTVDQWDGSSAHPGPSFAEQGVYATTYLHGDQPVAGVSVYRSGVPIPDDDYYFSDPGDTLTTIDPQQSATGADGAVLVTSGPAPVQYGASGGEPAGCAWPESLGTAIPGVVLVERKRAVTATGAICP